MQNRSARLAAAAAVAALLAASTAFVLAQNTAPARPVWAARVDAVFAEWDRTDSPGCAVGLYKDGTIAYERGYGMADLEHDAPITPETVFYSGSVSKQFTAMAAALAIKQGRFGLDDDVRKFVPELPDYGRPITVRHLIHHTSGLRDINGLMALAGRRDEDAFDNEAVLRILARQKALNALPGDAHLYSNSGYAVLALVIERATGTPFASFADANIFKPLGMMVTHFHTDLSRLVRHRAHAYDRRPGGGFGLNTPQNERAGAGGLFTTVHELARWDENFYDGRVGGLDTIRMLETPGRLNDGTILAYAWGLTPGSYRGLPLVEHSGSLGGYRAHIIRFRGEHLSVAALCNVSSVATGPLVRRVAEAVLGERLTEPAPQASRERGTTSARGPAVAYSPSELAAFAGRYDSDELETSYRVFVEDGQLRVRRGVQRQALTLQSGPRDEFTAAGTTLRFRRTADGSVNGLTVDADPIRGIDLVKR
jgi:CubicO group peptidase (beta-lactamase class C family)